MASIPDMHIRLVYDVNHDRRLKILRVSTELLVHTLLNPRDTTLIGIPLGCTAIPGAVHYSYITNTFDVMITHPSFAQIERGAEIPIADVQFRTDVDRRNDSSIDDADPSIKRYNQY